MLQFLKKRLKIIEIVAARDIVFALTQSAVCAAFSREANKKICYLNISPDEDEVIRSLFYNKNNDSLITMSVYASCMSSCFVIVEVSLLLKTALYAEDCLEDCVLC